MANQVVSVLDNFKICTLFNIVISRYAPESFNHGTFSHASDVWSFGVTLWEMYSLGEAPYAGEGGVDTIRRIEDGYRLPKPALCPESIYDMMGKCWYYNPRDRPTFKILEDFFKSANNDYSNLSELVSCENIN